MAIRFLVLQLALVSGMSLASRYQIPDLSGSNLDTVLFLTPFGIIHNHILESRAALYSFYSDISVGQISLSETSIELMILIYVGLIANFFCFLRATGKPVRDP